MAKVYAMSSSEARSSGEAFIDDLAAEFARIQGEYLALTAQRSAVQARFRDAGKRFATVLQSLPEGSQEVPLSEEALSLLDRNFEGPLTVNELRLDPLLHEIAEIKAEDADLLRKLAELAGASNELVLRRDTQDQLSTQQAAHALEKVGLSEFTAMQIKVSKTSSKTLPVREDVSPTIIRRIHGLDQEADKYTLTKLFEMYCEDHRHEWKDWANRVKRDYNRVRNMLVSLVGDLRLEQLTVAHSRAFTDKAKSVSAATGGSQTNAEKKVGYLRAVLTWANTGHASEFHRATQSLGRSDQLRGVYALGPTCNV
jgi:hypothetical protein